MTTDPADDTIAGYFISNPNDLVLGLAAWSSDASAAVA